MFSFIRRQLLKWFIDSLWPWFVVTIWPELRKLLIEMFVQVQDRWHSTFNEWLKSRNDNQQEFARKKAADAEARAKHSTSESESKNHRAIAQVWRQVADNFRQENEELKAKLRESLNRAKRSFQEEVNAMDIRNVIQRCDDGMLKLSGSQTMLALPALNDHAKTGSPEPFLGVVDVMDFDAKAVDEHSLARGLVGDDSLEFHAERCRDYEGNEYTVFGIALHSETREEFVIYRHVYRDNSLRVRPKQMFLESVDSKLFRGFLPVTDREIKATGPNDSAICGA